MIISPLTRFTIGLVFAASSNVACATDRLSASGDGQEDRHQWHSFDAEMSLDEYNESFRENRKNVVSHFKSTAKDALGSVGVPARTVDYMGAAIGLATRDTKFHLNESKSFSLQLMDLTQGDRGIYLGFKKGW